MRISIADRLVVEIDDELGSAAAHELDPCPPAECDGPPDIATGLRPRADPPARVERARRQRADVAVSRPGRRPTLGPRVPADPASGVAAVGAPAVGYVRGAVRGLERAAARVGSPLAGDGLDLLLRAGTQGERLSLTLSELRGVYGSDAVHAAGAPVSLGVMLRTVPGGPRGLLATALAGVRLIEVSCPFPADPRLVADLVEAHL